MRFFYYFLKFKSSDGNHGGKLMNFHKPDKTKLKFQSERREHWNQVASRRDHRFRLGSYYHQRIEEIYRFWIAPNQRVLELGCAEGDLLAAVKPSVGVGIDFSEKMIDRAKMKHSQLRFILADVEAFDLNETFDVIILSELINDLWDVQAILEKLQQFCTPSTRIVLNFFSHVWEYPLNWGRRLGLATPLLKQNWLTVEDVVDLQNLADFEVVHAIDEILWPFWTPAVASIFNKFLVKLWPFKMGALTHLMVIRPKAQKRIENPLVSVIIPARNEEGNISEIIRRVPEMGSGTELVFVEGHSKDDTYVAIERAISDHPQRKCQLHRQTGVGKGDAVRLGFSKAEGDVLMILDADMTVPPEDLIRFYEALFQGKGEFINGVRLIYPMENQAMRFLNLLGNKFFSMAFSWLLEQPIKDTLCGTKVLFKEDYLLISENRKYFGDFDPFGDFDLLFGAVKLNLKIIGLPIRYRDRTYGATNIQRWTHGWLLLKMVVFASLKIKFR
jgi:2-polyprenyl-3-methyl-5-hydroxy-6-metoxy-1,4-benzoquinol methylase